jgi:hypothetical protein
MPLTKRPGTSRNRHQTLGSLDRRGLVKYPRHRYPRARKGRR